MGLRQTYKRLGMVYMTVGSRPGVDRVMWALIASKQFPELKRSWIIICPVYLASDTTLQLVKSMPPCGTANTYPELRSFRLHWSRFGRNDILNSAWTSQGRGQGYTSIYHGLLYASTLVIQVRIYAQTKLRSGRRQGRRDQLQPSRRASRA